MKDALLTEDALFSDGDSRIHKVYLWLAFPLILGCYLLIEHRHNASVSVEAVTGVRYDGSENASADRSDDLNAGSSTGRFLLVGFGCIGLALPGGGKLRWRSLLLWSIAAYSFWTFSSLVWSVEREYTLFKLAVLFVFLFAAFGIARQLSLEEIGRVYVLICVTLVVIGVLTEISLGTFTVVGDYRFTGTKHPNSQAAYGAFACLGAFLFSKKSRLLAMSLFAIGLACILLTKSRTSLAGMVMGLIVIQGLRARGKQRLMLIAGGLVSLSFVSLFASLLGGQFTSKLGSAAAMGRTDDVTSLTGRLPLWEELLDTAAESPIIGHGYLAYWTPENIEYLGDLFNWEIPHGHNMYVDVLMDGGVIGLLLFLGMYLAGFTSILRHYSNTRDPAAALVVGYMVFAMINGMGESFFRLCMFPNFVLMTQLFRFGWHGESKRETEAVNAESRNIRGFGGGVT